MFSSLSRKAAIIAIVCFAGLLSTAACRARVETMNVPVRLLTANVGNADLMNCGQGYYYKLCLLEWEKPLSQSIAELDPDIVALQEVFDVAWCGQMPRELDKRKVCYRFDEREVKHQARRLLGPDYTIVCDARSHFECIGVKTSFASVIGCPRGDICRESGSLTHGAPDNCDTKPVVFGIDLEIDENIVRVVNGHPAASGEKCRAEQIRRLFEGYGNVPPLALHNKPSIIMGDMNMDPFRELQDSPDVKIWNKNVGKNKAFYYHSGPAENKDEPFKTAAGKTIDHVISNFAKGACLTLGEAEGTARLDRVESRIIVPESNDHRALFCNLSFPLKIAGPPSFEEVFPSEILDQHWDQR